MSEKEKVSITIRKDYIDQVKTLPGSPNFSAQIEFALRQYFKSQKTGLVGSINLDDLQKYAPDPNDLDEMFGQDKRVFSELSDKQCARLALDLIRRVPNDESVSGFDMSPLEAKLQQLDDLIEQQQIVLKQLNTLSELTKLSIEPDKFKARLVVALQSKDDDIALAIGEAIGI